jgi:hypothetical protein
MIFRLQDIYWLAFLGGLIVFASCASRKQAKYHQNCKEEIRDFLAENWSYNPDTKLYSEGSEMIRFVGKNHYLSACQKTLNQSDIIELFGEPHRKKNNIYYYYYFQHCLDQFDKTGRGPCLGYAEIKLSADSLFQSMGFGIVTREH